MLGEMRTILLASDGSASSDEALTFAVELAHEIGAALEIVCVRRGLAVEDAVGIAERARARANAAGVAARAHVTDGDVVGRIIALASELGADLLVVGARGLGSRSGASLGSVSQALVRRAPVPVTVVHHTPAAALPVTR